ncbi:MAG: EF-P lysine aminoacylase EpmA [Alphaproteobacteria bacterium]
MAWWTPEVFARRRAILEGRSAILATVRGFFAERAFIEVETPALQPCPGLEPHIKVFETCLEEPFGSRRQRLYLHTSPELAMKKLLVAGLSRIFQVARAYRNGERSPTHHPEFSMLEWYRTGADYRHLMADCEALLSACLTAVGETVFRWRGVACDPTRPWEYLTVAEAFARMTGIDLLATLSSPEDSDPDPTRLKAEAGRIGIASGENDRWEDVFFRVFLERIEPDLGLSVPTILYDYPAPLAALSRRKMQDPRLAERFELYVCGLELANAFSELTDPKEQRHRFLLDQALRQRLYGQTLPLDEEFLAALEWGLPECAGIALGLDRLVMLATGAETLEEVLWVPVSSA